MCPYGHIGSHDRQHTYFYKKTKWKGADEEDELCEEGLEGEELADAER